jgi:hypothetical protein
VNDDNLAIEDGPLYRDIEAFCNEREAIGPIVPVAGKDCNPTLVQVNLDTIAVILDFMDPLVPDRRFSF